MEYLWLAFIAGMGAVQKLLQKKYSAGTADKKTAGVIFSWITAISSTVFFAAMAGFKLMPNSATLLLSSVYAIVCIASLVYTNFVYQKMSLAKVTLFASCGSLTVPYIFDVCFLDGDITVKKTVAVLMLIAVFLLPLLDPVERRKGSKSELFFGSVTFTIAGASTVISKLFTINANGVSSETFCFWTNLFMIPLLAVKLAFGKEKQTILPDFKRIGVKYAVIVVIIGFIGAVITPISLKMIGQMNITVYTIVSNSLSLIFAAVVSAVIFRERTEIRTVIGLLASVAAIVLCSV